MYRCVIGVSLCVLSNTVPATAQTAVDRSTVASLPASFSAAWSTHQGDELAKLVSEDVDFVNVGAIWLRGKANFAKYHSRILTARLAASTITPLATDVRFVRADLALIRWSWRIDGERDSNGAAMPARYGLMTLVAERRRGKWQVIAGQNTNSGPLRPEAADIQGPIIVPRAP
ncbi:SgcJ/EcaC family oxidoreductase [Sphingomonas panacisoli]|uniref:SgcJ/EcaC family oxidoreductase n=1 Tax=Sphingomonas panacisoli TaxID=1813879 RepID=A0A5B8LK47_9SPHN|nr:SgcJ/EcaC family oxidoreductase [Sphingomonas panacisoli]QDZ08105.1 SgcJ/EcaC family oxidoreductase [Sphingomonas panacisoli]